MRLLDQLCLQRRFLCVMSAVVVSSAMSSCGIGPGQQGGSDILPRRTISESGVLTVEPEDNECVSNGTGVNLSEVQIWQWNGTQVVSKRVPFQASVGENGQPVTKGVTANTGDLRVETNCRQDGNGDESCDKGSKVFEQDSFTLKICRSDGAYSRESMESELLNSQYFTDDVRSFYERIPGHRDGLMRPEMLVQLLSYDNITDDTGHTALKMDVNNAFFSPASKAFPQGILAVLPTSQKMFEKNPVHLWEVPFVLRHENGHNVFHLHVGDISDAVGAEKGTEFNFHRIMGRGTSWADDFGLTASASQVTDAGKIAVKGVNELFADLFAYYAGGGVPDQLKGITFLDATRDPSASQTLSGIKKEINAVYLDQFEGRKPGTKPTASGEPSFTDEHDIAAMLGYPVASLINAAYVGKSTEERAAVLIRWLDKLAPYIPGATKNAKLDEMLALLVRVIREDQVLNSSVCQDFKTLVSGLKTTMGECVTP